MSPHPLMLYFFSLSFGNGTPPPNDATLYISSISVGMCLANSFGLVGPFGTFRSRNGFMGTRPIQENMSRGIVCRGRGGVVYGKHL